MKTTALDSETNDCGRKFVGVVQRGRNSRRNKERERESNRFTDIPENSKRCLRDQNARIRTEKRTVRKDEKLLAITTRDSARESVEMTMVLKGSMATRMMMQDREY